MKSENQEDVIKLADRVVVQGSTICADESHAYDPLHAKYDTKRVNHQTEYSTDDGVSNNMAERTLHAFAECSTTKRIDLGLNI